MKSFEQICRYSQKNVKKYVARELRNIGYEDVCIDDGFVFAKGEIPILICAHMDTVHESVPTKIYKATEKGTTKVFAREGIGGDDRCGIYMCLKIAGLRKPSVLFLEDEEIGCVGATKFTKNNISTNLKFNFILEFDRMNANDAVFYECDNPEFTDFVTKEFYVENWGSCSDISEIAPYIGCAAVNLSCGYYNQHTKNEYVVLEEMERSIQEAIKLIDRTDFEKDKFEYIEAEYNYRWGVYAGGKLSTVGGWAGLAGCSNGDVCYSGYGDYYFQYVGSGGRLLEDMVINCLNLEEAVGKFVMDHPSVCFDDIYDWYVDTTCGFEKESVF